MVLLGRELIQVSGVVKSVSDMVEMGGGSAQAGWISIPSSIGSFLGHTSGGAGGQLGGCMGDTEPGGVQTGGARGELLTATHTHRVHNFVCPLKPLTHHLFDIWLHIWTK